MNIFATADYKFQPFTLMCAFPEVKEKLFLEVFASKDWSHPCIEKVLQKPQCYPSFKYYIAYIGIQLGKIMPELARETMEIKIFRDELTCRLHPECYIALALARELIHPLHNVNEYLEFNDQPYVVEKLLKLGFNPNEKATSHTSIKRPFVSLWDIEPEGYTPIYYATHLTAPILIKYGAQVQLDNTYYQPINQLLDCYDEYRYYESEDTIEHLRLLEQILVDNGAHLRLLEQILVDNGAIYPNESDDWDTEDDTYWIERESDRF